MANTTNQDLKVHEAQNADLLLGKWSELKGRIMQKWVKLTTDDLAMVNGRRDELIGVLQRRYGYDRLRAEQEVKNFLDKPQHT